MCSEKTEQLAALVAQDRGARKAEEPIIKGMVCCSP